MSNKTFLMLAVAVVTIVLQLVTPLAMVAKYSTILQQGVAYRFSVELADSFKGRYMRLEFPIAQGEFAQFVADLGDDFHTRMYRKKPVLVLLETDNDGLAKIKTLSVQKPESGDYLNAHLIRTSEDEYGIHLPFNRYYAEESKVPEIESLVWQDAINEPITALVRIKDGDGVIEELFVGDQPILDYLRDKQK